MNTEKRSDISHTASWISLEEGCINCLTYFGIFNYPLNSREVFIFNPVRATQDEVTAALQNLVKSRKVFEHQDFYSLEDEKGWVDERLRGNHRALKLLGKSRRFSSVISAFPFIEGIAISGSLSKFYVLELPDIDYFIITTARRLWIARTLLHLFKKLTFLIGHQHYYCMNYFIDTEALSIQHRNQYSAIETATLLPVYNSELFQEFYNQNRWVDRYLPNHPGITNPEYIINEGNRRGISWMQKAINMLPAEKLNRYLLRVTDIKWRKKWSGHGFTEEEYNRSLQTELHISKNHPVDYEKIVLTDLEKRRQTLV